MKLRVLAASTALAVGTTFGTGAALVAADPATASAQAPAPAPLTTQIPCTVGGVSTTCTLAVTSLQVVNGVLQATGTVTSGSTTVPFSGVPVTNPSGSCPVLTLNLGPLHLDLLGLVVDLSQVNLNITAQPGPGQLLGNLLCAVTNLLNNNAAGTAVTNLLNHINSILAGL